jgi:hypothetical protein
VITNYYDFKTHPDGSISGKTYLPKLQKYIYSKAGPFYDEKCNIVGAIEIIDDITEEKRLQDIIEQKVRKWKNDDIQNNGKFQTVISSIKDTLNLINNTHMIL